MSQEDIDAALAGTTGDAAAQGAAAGAAEQAVPAEVPASGEATPDAAAAAPETEQPAEAVTAETKQPDEAVTAPAAATEQPAGAVAAQPAAAPADDGGGLVGLTQADIDAALAGAGGAEPAPAAAAAPEAVKLDSAGRPFDEMAAMMEAAIAEERAAAPAAQAAAPAAPAAPLPPLPANAVPLNLPDFAAGGAGPAGEQGIELLNDVELNVKIELGRAEMLIEEVIKLGEGSVVELDKLAGDPVDVLVNDRLVARGEVIVLNENFCVRVSEIVAGIPEEEAA